MADSLAVGDQASADRITILTTYQDDLAQLAWQGYLHRGRGVVVISYMTDIRFTYLSHQQIAKFVEAKGVSALKHHVAQYRPVREVLCLFASAEGCCVYCAECEQSLAAIIQWRPLLAS